MPNFSRFSFKFRPTLITHSFFITGIIVAAMLFMQFNSSKSLALRTTEKSFQELSNKILNQLNIYGSSSKSFLNILEQIDCVTCKPEPNIRHKISKVFISYIKSKNYVYSTYIGKKDGTFYEIINLNLDKNIKAIFKAPANARWLIVKIIDKIRYDEFLDSNLVQISSIQKKAIYNPATRPWFKKAIVAKGIIKTDPYIFSMLQKAGSTYSKKVQGTDDTVVSVDISMDSIRTLLKKQPFVKGSELFLYDDKGKILTYSKTGFEEKKLKNTLEDYHKNLLINNEKNIITLEGKKYFQKTYTLVSDKNHGEYLKVLSPIDKIMAPYLKEIYTYLIITLLVFIFIAIPLVFYSSRLITGPISQIIKENEKIKQRRFKKIKKIKSHIQEVNELSKSLVSMAMAIKNYEEEQKELMDSFIKLMATAIDEKSKYTGGHCSRVPVLSMMLMKKASFSNEKAFENFKIENEDELRELSVSAWLHDCGKVTTPEYVMDKATKLETNYNRIHEIRTRFEVLYRDTIIKAYEEVLDIKTKENISSKLQKELEKLQDEFACIAHINIGSEFTAKEDIEKIRQIAQRKWMRYFDNSLGLSYDEELRFYKHNSSKILPCEETLLSDKKWHIIPRDNRNRKDYDKFHFHMDIPKNLYNLGELYNLTIKKGTLNKEERYKIQEHIIMTIKMLEQLPFPQNLKNVPLYAGAHHETLIGTGYPRKLKKEDMPLPSRIIALADVFEALSAADRPYKKAKKTLSECIGILSLMVKEQHIDKDLFRLFLTSGVYKEYAKKYLLPEQIDEVDINTYL
jgi:HD-GYP domain-containing protein (c-di-GMP phosphodiesterase class II)